MNRLTASKLSKSYQSRAIIHDISLSIAPKEIIGLLGPNGAGKTTCFYMMLGLLKPDSGHIHLNNHEITTLSAHQRARLGIGYLPQEASIFRKMSIEDNIMAILETRRGLNEQTRARELEKLLDEFNLQATRRTLGISLSGGERRRAEIARTLASDPRYIFLDEPFAGIDPISLIDIKMLIRSLSARGIGILITDHNVRETLDICDKAYILSGGVVIAEGTPSHILASPEVREVYLGDHFRL